MNYQPTPRRHRTASERERLLVEYEDSDLTQKDFARRNGISLSCLVSWLRQSRGPRAKEPGPSFLPLPVDLPALNRARPTYKIGFANGHSLELPSGFQVDELERLCQLLHSL